MVQSNALTSLNPSVLSQNLTFNVDVAYVTGMGFNYYDNSPKIVQNKVFGNYKITKNTASDFRTTWTVNKGRVWSDGTPIDGVDLLLSHVLSSSAYSKAAGLGDPADENSAPAFNAGGYGGLYDDTIVGEPKLSADKMGVTLQFKFPIPDWDIYGPGVSPVHALVRLAEGKKTLGTLKENLAAKQKFLTAFQKKDTAFLKKMGAVWSTAYNIKTVDKNTNPLLLVGNGPYMVKSAVPDQSVTVVLNPKYNSGPKTNGIKTLVFRVIGDGTAAAQALANREVDIYAGQPTADAVFLLKSIVGINVVGTDQAIYEHIDFRHGTANGRTDAYDGPFAGTNSAKGRDLRKAVALAWPRQEIVDKLVKPINPTSVLMNSITQFPKEPGYSKMVNGSGVKEFADGTQAERTAKALALVKKYYPNASASNPGFTLKVLWGAPSNQRRASEAALATAELAKAGIKVDAPGLASWSPNLGSAAYDLSFFAWVKNAITQTSPCGQFRSDGTNNYLGYKSSIIDDSCQKLNRALTKDQVLDEYLKIEKELMSDVVSLPIFQHPGVTAVRAELKNVKPGPLSPNLVWNFWEWKY
jgi:peptide/nickel transport system substrate-binding protein